MVTFSWLLKVNVFAALVVPMVWLLYVAWDGISATAKLCLPVPVRFAVCGLLLALSLTLNCPVLVPLCVGVNSTLTKQLADLRTERTNLANQLKHVDAALSVLGGSSYTKPRHTMSAAARRRISLAQKARWAKAKGHAPKPKRTISAAGRKRIAAAQRARWAKVKSGKK